MSETFYIAGTSRKQLEEGNLLTVETDQLFFTLLALERILRGRLFKEAQTIDEAELVIFIHPYLEVYLTAHQVAQFEFPSSVRKVILLRPNNLRLQKRSDPEICDYAGIWVFALDPLPGIFEALKDFLGKTVATRKFVHHRRHIALEALQELSTEILGLTSEDLKNVLLRFAEHKGFVEPKRFGHHTHDLYVNGFSQRDANQWRLDYCLELLTSDILARRHEFHLSLDRPFKKTRRQSPLRNAPGDMECGQVWQLRRFVEFCSDLKEALLTSRPPKAEDEPNQPLDKILIIDDHITPEVHRLRRMLGKLFFDDENVIALFDPMRTKGEANGRYTSDLLDYLRNYHALRYGTPPAPVQETLATLQGKVVKEGFRFILVDQFFHRMDERREEFCGPEFIRGLIRYFEDHGVVLYDGSTPEVIALSRTDDPQVIRSALRAGAKDYILKSRILRLPGVLQRVARSSGDRVRKLHQNFQVLHTLRNETIGLLQSLKIPRVPYHRAPAGDQGFLYEESATIHVPDRKAHVRNWGCLLGALPKVDLHVHVGSCMSVEFLVYASFVGLLRLKWVEFHLSLRALLRHFDALTKEGTHHIELRPAFALANESSVITNITCGVNWIDSLAKATRGYLQKVVAAMIDDVSSGFQSHQPPNNRHGSHSIFRAALQKSLGIPDYVKPEEIAARLSKKPALTLAVFALRHAKDVPLLKRSEAEPPSESPVGEDDIKRLYLLHLATRFYKEPNREIDLLWKRQRVLNAIKEFVEDASKGKVLKKIWEEASRVFYSTNGSFSYERFRTEGWTFFRKDCTSPPLTIISTGLSKSDVTTAACGDKETDDCIDRKFRENPIYYTLASGTRSTNLIEYLEGCEFSGAEHLRHPFLVHLYAQQTVVNFVREGIFYAELRGSPDGYVQPEFGFEFVYACRAMLDAFSLAQSVALEAFNPVASDQRGWLGHLLGESFKFETLQSLFGTSKLTTPEEEKIPAPLRKRLPCKVSLIFVGKRHKSTREMILEAAAVAVMQAPSRDALTTNDFVKREFGRCRVVGFDLAGQESDNPPELFADEFSRIARLHIPITVHAGENAPPSFIENAILRLRAKRIGHGLSLTEDPALMTRAREDRVCVELCPVCNHQTSHFASPKAGGENRKYPLRDLLDAGIFVTINTDNPIISDTNMTKEFFQASYAYDEHGLPLWEALRLLRMGYVSSFLTLRERRHMIELVGQYLFDIFSDEEVVNHLRSLSVSP